MKKIIKQLFLITSVCITLLQAQGQDTVFSKHHEAQGEKHHTTEAHRIFVVVGSSTAQGVGATKPDSCWVSRFREYMTRLDSANQVINLAVGGYTTYHAMPDHSYVPPHRPVPDTAHNITKAMTYHPTDIIISFPTNDITYGYPLTEQLRNLDSLFSYSKLGVTLWMATTQPRNLDSLHRMYLRQLKDSIIERYHDHVLDFYSGLAATDGKIDSVYSRDCVHPNNAGHRLLFERVVNTIMSSKLSRPAAE